MAAGGSQHAPIIRSGLAVTQITLPETPKAPELGFVVLGDARFYVVWRVHGVGDLPLPQPTGIWCGEGVRVWYELLKYLPGCKYGLSELKKYHSWEAAWSAWWTEGKHPKPKERPNVYHIVTGGGDAAR